MSSRRSTLADAIAALARALPDETIARVAESLTSASTADEGIRRLEQLVTSASARELAQRVVSAWRAEASVPSPAVALALDSAGRLDRDHRNEQQIELVWTGPAPAGTTLRRSDQVMLDLVRGAGDKLTIVSFAAYRVASVHEALLAALDRGVDVRFILESREESGGRVTVDPWAAMSRELAIRCARYIWPFDQRPASAHGRVGVLHAKCAISDERCLFVSSANFTGAALTLNMELGLLIEGGEMPSQVQQHFDQLISDQVLRRVDARQ